MTSAVAHGDPVTDTLGAQYESDCKDEGAPRYSSVVRGGLIVRAQ